MLSAAAAVAATPARKSSLNLGDTNADLVYTPLAPCRIVDTRVASGFMTGGSTRSFKVAGSTGFDLQGGNASGCGVPIGATSVLINFTAVNPDGIGNLKGSAYPNPIPATGSIINYQLLNPTLNVANAVAFPICDPSVNTCSADITLFTNGGGTHVVADVLGFFRRFPKEQMITSINPGTGLTGGGTSGSISLGIDTTGATSGQALTFNGATTTWTTMPAGTITGVTAGNGLTGGGTSGTVPLAVNFGGTGSATTVARSDHTHYARTIIVSPLATAAQSGTALLNAVNNLTTASATNPYLVHIEPGVFDLGSSSLSIRSYIDIEGSGQDVTTIRSSATVANLPNAGELRNLTMQTTGICVAIGNNCSATLRHVTLKDDGTSAFSGALIFGGGLGSAPRLEDVTITSSAPGVNLITFGPDNAAIQPTITLVLRRVSLQVSGCVGTNTCNGITVEQGGTLDADGVEMTLNSTSSSTAAGIATTGGGSISLRHATITVTSAASGTLSAGINNSGVPADLRDVEITATGGSNAIAFSNSDASIRVANSTLVASGGGISNQGVSSTSATAPRTLIFENCRINGSWRTIAVAGSNQTLQVSNSKLEGGAVAAATAQCTFITDENLAGYANTCP